MSVPSAKKAPRIGPRSRQTPSEGIAEQPIHLESPVGSLDVEEPLSVIQEQSSVSLIPGALLLSRFDLGLWFTWCRQTDWTPIYHDNLVPNIILQVAAIHCTPDLE